MASIRRELVVEVGPAAVWNAIRDVGAVHTRVAHGFVVGTELEDGARKVTFANGLRVRELIVTVDDERRRLVYAAVGGRTSHHNASFEVLAEGTTATRLVWQTDLLPDSAGPAVEAMMNFGVEAMRRTFSPDGAGHSSCSLPHGVVVD